MGKQSWDPLLRRTDFFLNCFIQVKWMWTKSFALKLVCIQFNSLQNTFSCFSCISIEQMHTIFFLKQKKLRWKDTSLSIILLSSNASSSQWWCWRNSLLCANSSSVNCAVIVTCCVVGWGGKWMIIMSFVCNDITIKAYVVVLFTWKVWWRRNIMLGFKSKLFFLSNHFVRRRQIDVLACRILQKRRDFRWFPLNEVSDH